MCDLTVWGRDAQAGGNLAVGEVEASQRGNLLLALGQGMPVRQVCFGNLLIDEGGLQQVLGDLMRLAARSCCQLFQVLCSRWRPAAARLNGWGLPG